MSEKDWKRLYEQLLKRSESEKEANQELERLLTRTITRLTVAAMGLDHRLDPHLKGIRNAVRKGLKSREQEQFQALSDGLLHYSQEPLEGPQGVKSAFQHLLAELTLSGKELAELEELLAQLVADPAEMQQRQFKRLTDLLGQGEGASVKRGGLFDRLFGGGAAEEEAGLQPNKILLNLLDKASWPGHWGEQINELKQRLIDKEATAEAWIEVLEDLLDLSAKSFGEIQSEIKEAEDFLEELTQRLQDLGVHLQSAHEGRDAIARHGRDLSQTVNGQVGELGSHVAQATDLHQLREAVSQRLIQIKQSIDSYLAEEMAWHEQADKSEKVLRERLAQLELESSELRSRMVEAHHMALLDTVTGLPNRLAYEERVEQEMARWKRFDNPLTLLVWDVDDFKSINDRFGHQAGDKALRVIAQSLKARLRETDFIARFGGEEFVCLLCGAQDEEAFSVAEEMRLSVESSAFHSQGKPVRVTISCGIASFRQGDSLDNVFSRADRALYQAKRKGKNRCELAGR
jgi:diguanylate cyclase